MLSACLGVPAPEIGTGIVPFVVAGFAIGIAAWVRRAD